jgi:hypothetical protein
MSGRIGTTYWPDVSTTSDAEKAVKTAAYVAFFVAAVTGVLSLLAVFSTVQILSGWDILDAVAFVLLGLWILRGSRAAAVLALLLYIVELVVGIATTGGGNPVQFVVGLIFVFAFINGVRGAYSLRRLEGDTDSRA